MPAGRVKDEAPGVDDVVVGVVVEGLLQVSRELRALNDSLNAVAYAALGQSPQVRRRAG